jgi:hypothetical protein
MTELRQIQELQTEMQTTKAKVVSVHSEVAVYASEVTNETVFKT